MSTQMERYGDDLSYEEWQAWRNSNISYNQWIALHHQQNLTINNTQVNQTGSSFWEIWHALATSALVWFLLIGCQLWIPALALAIITLIIYSIYKILELICKLLWYPFKKLI